MAFWLIVIKALKVKLAVSKLKRAKLNAYRKSRGLSPTYPWYEAIVRCIFRTVKYIFLRAFCWCLIKKGKDGGPSIWESFWISGTLPNSVLKSFTGLLCGLFFTYLITIFLIFQLNISPYVATFGTMFFGIFLTFSLAFSELTRLFVFLTVPQFFTRKGRAAILAYAIILAVSGPGKNTTRNMEVLTESIICTQEMAKNATSGLVRLVKDPMNAIGKAMKSVVDTVMEAANSIKSSLKHLMDVISSVVNVILFAFDWLKKIVEVCNQKVGTPFDRCWKAFDEAIEDCNYQLGSLFSWMCNVTNLFQNICYVAKIVDALCWLPSLVKDVVFKPIKKLLQNFMESVKTFFDVRIPIPTYKFDHSMTTSKKFKDIIHDMKTEVSGELQWFLGYLDWMDLLVSAFIFLALYKAVIYRHRFLNMDRHDNFYITKGLVKLDWSRKKLGREFIFPLSYRESRLYVQTYSFSMLKEERKKLRNSLIMVTLGATQILNYMLLDFGLYLFLELLRRHGSIRVDTRNMLGYNIKITGTGFMADMYRAILKALSPIGGLLPVFDTSPCLPLPSIPDYIRYAILICLMLLCYLATLTEPYCMRLRHIICGIYYPERKNHRDRWLYYHILKSRGTFANYARSQIKARLLGDKMVFRISLLDRLSHTIPGFRYVVSYFSVKRKECMLCGKKGDMDDMENFYKCPICESIYCMECYDSLGKVCPAHKNVFDSSGEISEEIGSDSSSDEGKVSQKPTKSTVRKVFVSPENKVEDMSDSSRNEKSYTQIDSSELESGDEQSMLIPKEESKNVLSPRVTSRDSDKISSAKKVKYRAVNSSTSEISESESESGKLMPKIHSSQTSTSNASFKSSRKTKSNAKSGRSFLTDKFRNLSKLLPEKVNSTVIPGTKEKEIMSSTDPGLVRGISPSFRQGSAKQFTSSLQDQVKGKTKSKVKFSDSESEKSVLFKPDKQHVLKLSPAEIVSGNESILKRDVISNKNTNSQPIRSDLLMSNLVQRSKSQNLIKEVQSKNNTRIVKSLESVPSQTRNASFPVRIKSASVTELLQPAIHMKQKSQKEVSGASPQKQILGNQVSISSSKRAQPGASGATSNSEFTYQVLGRSHSHHDKNIETDIKHDMYSSISKSTADSQKSSANLTEQKHPNESESWNTQKQNMNDRTEIISKQRLEEKREARNALSLFELKNRNVSPISSKSWDKSQYFQNIPQNKVDTQFSAGKKFTQFKPRETEGLVSHNEQTKQSLQILPTESREGNGAKQSTSKFLNSQTFQPVQVVQPRIPRQPLKLKPPNAEELDAQISTAPTQIALRNKFGERFPNKPPVHISIPQPVNISSPQLIETGTRDTSIWNESKLPHPSSIKGRVHRPLSLGTKKHVRFSDSLAFEDTSEWESDDGRDQKKRSREKQSLTSSEIDSRVNDFTESSCDEHSCIDENMYLEEVDCLDKGGICHHHQSVEEEVYNNFDDVLSEMESSVESHFTSNSEGSSDEKVDSTIVEPDETDISMRSDQTDGKLCCGQERARKQFPIQRLQNTHDVHRWVQNSDPPPVLPSVSQGLMSRVQQLDSFYYGMPYPPHSNVYKS